MGKFNVSGVTNQINEIDALGAGVDLPTGPVKEEAVESPQTGGGSILDQGLADLDAGIIEEGVTAGLDKEQDLADQREREQVPDIITRRDDQARVDTYDYKGKIAEAEATRLAKVKEANDGTDPNGGLSARASNMANLVTTKKLGIGGLSKAADNQIKTAFHSVGAIDVDGNFDRGFLQMASVVTENTVANLAFGEGVDNVTYDEITGDKIEIQRSEEQRQGQSPITKAQGNAALGKQINREWQKYRNSQEGKPVDEYTDITEEQAVLIGDTAKELYYEANKQQSGTEFMQRATTDDGQTAFTLTKKGADLLAKGASLRKKMFPTEHVRPAKVPTPHGQLVKEGQVYTKKVSSQVRKQLVGAEVIKSAMTNLNKVANVVDPQRLKILLATALPVLSGEVDPNSPEAIINNVGTSQYEKFTAKGKKDTDFDPDQTYEELIHDLAQNVYGITKERKGANHLTYYLQAFNGRIAPQQTHFDPTSSKAVRFVTRNAVPSKATPGSRIERNLRQMYAMMIVPGKFQALDLEGKSIEVKADALLPAQRERALENATPKLVRWGKELKASLDTISNEQVEAAAEAIANGVPVTDPSFPKLPLLSLSDPELIQTIKDKGEDGQAFIDGVLDFTSYYEKKLKGLPHDSYFNAYMDGKTNGLAANGIQMGSEKLAYKTGVLRSQNKTLLDNDEDLRGELKRLLLEDIDTNGFPGKDFNGKINDIATKVFGLKDLNKSTTMTFGYGMELDSMKKVISNTLDEMAEGDPELARDLNDAVGNDPENRKELDAALHSKYVSIMPQVLDEDAISARALLRSAAVMHALTNELFNLRTATGFELNIGGTDATSQGIEGERYRVWTGKGYEGRTAYHYGEEVSSAATKRRTDDEGNPTAEVGGVAYGGAVPAPVQSLDAATVALTSSGKSWAKLRNASGGVPYLHTIYDAFKVDAMGYDVVLNEVNQNWLDAAMDWSYLEETRNAIRSMEEKFTQKSGPFSDYDKVPSEQFKMAEYLLRPIKNDKGNIFPSNLKAKLGKILESQEPDASYKATQRIITDMRNVGYNVYNPPADPTFLHLKTLVGSVKRELNLNSRLNTFINRTNEKKKKLKAKIKADGNKVYQYYAH